MLEAGCGVGNTIFPILAWTNSVHFYACDISEEAIRLLQVSLLSFLIYCSNLLSRKIQLLIGIESIVL